MRLVADTQKLASKPAILAFRAFFIVTALILISDAIKSAQVIGMFGVEFGTRLWFVSALFILSSAVAVISMLLMARHWVWAVWTWACAILGIAIAGVLIGLNTAFVFRRDVILPWVVLALSATLKSRFATPWRGGT